MSTRIRPDFGDIIIAYGKGESAGSISHRFHCSKSYVSMLVVRYGHLFEVTIAPRGGKREGAGRRRASICTDLCLIASRKLIMRPPRPLTLPSIRGWTADP